MTIKRAGKIIAVIVFIGVVAALYAVIFAIPRIEGLSLKTEIIEYSDLPIQNAVKGVFVRTETLYLAASSGQAQYLVEDGTKIRRGMQVFYVDTTKSPPAKEEGAEDPYATLMQTAGGDAEVTDGGIAPETAIFSTYADGWEKKLTPDTLQTLTKDVLKKAPAEATNLKREWVRTNEPAYKITDNNLWYFVFWEKGANTDYEIGKKLTLDLGSTRVTVKVESADPQGSSWRYVLSSDMYYKDLDKYRVKDATLILAEYSGAVVGKKAISIKDGEKGVYVRQQSGTWKWVRVNVIRESEDSCLISENTFYDEGGNTVRTVNYYDEVMSDPAEEGY